jgi:hypothetical protein
MFHFRGHGQDDRAEGIAGGAFGIGGLLGMSALPTLSAAGTPTGLDIELGDDRHDGGQIGLILHDQVLLVEGHVTQRTFFERHLNNAIDLLGSGRGPQVGLVSWATSRLFGRYEIAVGLLAAKRMSLPMLVTATVAELPAQVAVFAFEFLDTPIALLATRTLWTDAGHDHSPKL